MPFPVDTDDDHRQWLRRLQQGEREAWESLFELYNEALCQFIGFLKFVDREDVDDIANQTWEKAWRARNSIGGVSKLRAWIFRIARNTAVDSFRKRQKREEMSVPRSQSPDEEDRNEMEMVADPSDLEDQAMTFTVVDEAWKKTLERISCNQKSCFLFSEENGLSFAKIAKILCLTEGTVEIYISVVKRRFREEYRRLQEGDNQHE